MRFRLGKKATKGGEMWRKFSPSKGTSSDRRWDFTERRKNIFEITCRHSVNQCFVPWMRTLFGDLESRSGSFLTANELLWPGSFLRGLQDDPAQVVLQQGHRLLPKKRVSQSTSKIVNLEIYS